EFSPRGGTDTFLGVRSGRGLAQSQVGTCFVQINAGGLQVGNHPLVLNLSIDPARQVPPGIGRDRNVEVIIRFDNFIGNRVVNEAAQVGSVCHLFTVDEEAVTRPEIVV